MASQEPFPETVEEVLRERGWSRRELARRTQNESHWGAVSTIHLLLRGELRPTAEAMEKIATALRVPPEHFAEYRLAIARRNLDPEAVGLKRALKNLGE